MRFDTIFAAAHLFGSVWRSLAGPEICPARLAPAPQCPRSAPSAAASMPRGPALAFTGVTVIDVTDGRLVPDQTVVIIGTRIQAVGPAHQVRVPPDAQVVDAQGKYLIPGLWDMHVHPHLSLKRPWLYPRLIAHGVTGIRDAGSWVSLDTLLPWRREIAAGHRVGPRQILAGPTIPTARPVPRTPDEGRRLVDSLKAAGADFIKMRTNNNQPTGWPIEVWSAMADQARRRGIPFGGHLPHAPKLVNGEMRKARLTPLEASDSGASIVDHYHFLMGGGTLCMEDTVTVESCQVAAERLRHNGTWLALTLTIREQPSRKKRGLAPFGDEATSPEDTPWYRNLSLMDQAGVPFLAATDAGGQVDMGESLHDELLLLVWAGLRPLTALQAATLNPAKHLKGTDSLGTVAAGKLADLVLLDANPLVDIRHTRTIRAVVANGRYFDRAALDALDTESRLFPDPLVARSPEGKYTRPVEYETEISIRYERFRSLADSLAGTPPKSAAYERLRQRQAEELGAMRATLTDTQQGEFDAAAGVWLRAQTQQGYRVAIPNVTPAP